MKIPQCSNFSVVIGEKLVNTIKTIFAEIFNAYAFKICKNRNPTFSTYVFAGAFKTSTMCETRRFMTEFWF
jgi:hypothetical protein